MNEFFHHYAELLTDPAHLAVELTLMLLVDVIFFGMLVPFLMRHMQRTAKKAAHAEHLVIDAEHGVDHHDVSAATAVPVRRPAVRYSAVLTRTAGA